MGFRLKRVPLGEISLGFFEFFFSRRKNLLTDPFEKLPRRNYLQMAVSALVAELFSLAFFKIHTPVRKFLLTEIFAKIPRSQGAGMEAFAMVSEEFCLAVFHLHTNRRNFLLTDDSATKPRQLPVCRAVTEQKYLLESAHSRRFGL